MISPTLRIAKRGRGGGSDGCRADVTAATHLPGQVAYRVHLANDEGRAHWRGFWRREPSSRDWPRSGRGSGGSASVSLGLRLGRSGGHRSGLASISIDPLPEQVPKVFADAVVEVPR